MVGSPDLTKEAFLIFSNADIFMIYILESIRLGS